MNIGFIGAGKVGCSLGKYFAVKGQEYSLNVKGYHSLSRKSALEAAQFTGSEAYEDIGTLVSGCDVIFLTVPDGSIGEAWQQVKECDIKEKTICHCSGAMSAGEAFEGIDAAGAFGYSVHPLFAVSDKYNAYRELTGVFFTLEGGRTDGDAKDSPEFIKLREALESMGNPTGVINAGDKITYHCATAVASNLVCGLVDQSVEMLKRCGFSEDEAVSALAPTLMGNMGHIVRDGPVDSLTGPVERNDVATVREHLASFGDDEEREIYRLLTGRLVRMAQRRYPERDYGEMAALAADKADKADKEGKADKHITEEK